MNDILQNHHIQEFNEIGFTVIPNVIPEIELKGAQEALREHYPDPVDYFNTPDRFEELTANQFAGLRLFPWNQFSLNRLTVHPNVIQCVTGLLRTTNIRLAKAELWAKFGNRINYDQEHHRDYGNHALTVPRRDGLYREATTFIFLSDITPTTSPTALVPKPVSDSIPYGMTRSEAGSMRDCEMYATGDAGSLMVYSYEIFHRGTAMVDPKGFRFTLLADYRDAKATWIGKHNFGRYGLERSMTTFLENISPEQRSLIDFPAPGHRFWNKQTIDDCLLRYPNMDMTPYINACDTYT